MLMNDLSNKLMSMNANMQNFAQNKDAAGDAGLEILMDKKMFYLCDINKSGGEKKKVKAKKGTSSEVSKKSSDSSEKVMTAFSLRDLQKLNTNELASKIFSLSEELTRAGVKAEDIENLTIKDKFIGNLACM